MSQLPHLPALRLGRPYRSLDQFTVKDHKTGEARAEVSSVNAGIIRKDMKKLAASRAALKRFTCAQLIELSAKAGDLFLNGTLPLGDAGHTQTPQQYIETLSTTSGLPWNMVRRNMDKVHFALTNMKFVLNGLSRGLDLSILDAGTGEQFGTKLSFFPSCQALGLVMPSNPPAVNSLWLPAIALKTPVVIKPGREEPWTPYRLIQAFIAAGVAWYALSRQPKTYAFQSITGGVTKKPWLARTLPAPLQWRHVDMPVPGFAPDPSQVWQAASVGTSISTVRPANASSRLISRL